MNDRFPFQFLLSLPCYYLFTSDIACYVDKSIKHLERHAISDNFTSLLKLFRTLENDTILPSDDYTSCWTLNSWTGYPAIQHWSHRWPTVQLQRVSCYGVKRVHRKKMFISCYMFSSAEEGSACYTREILPTQHFWTLQRSDHIAGILERQLLIA